MLGAAASLSDRVVNHGGEGVTHPSPAKDAQHPRTDRGVELKVKLTLLQGNVKLWPVRRSRTTSCEPTSTPATRKPTRPATSASASPRFTSASSGCVSCVDLTGLRHHSLPEGRGRGGLLTRPAGSCKQRCSRLGDVPCSFVNQVGGTESRPTCG